MRALTFILLRPSFVFLTSTFVLLTYIYNISYIMIKSIYNILLFYCLLYQHRKVIRMRYLLNRINCLLILYVATAYPTLPTAMASQATINGGQHISHNRDRFKHFIYIPFLLFDTLDGAFLITPYISSNVCKG